MKIAVATPSRGLIHSRTVAAVMANLAGQDFAGWFISHDLPIPECAETTMAAALATGADAVWSVEEDTIPPPGALAASIALLEQGYAIAAVDYPVLPDTGCMGKDAAGNILWVGLGSTLISRKAFEVVERPWFRVDRFYGGHDMHFCRQVLAAGLRIGQVPGLSAGHAKVDQIGAKGNMGCHKIRVMERILHQYSEAGPAAPASLGDGVVVLVPRRADNGQRDKLWVYCRDWWKRTVDVPVFEGHHDTGPFNRSAAINAAAQTAGAWAVAVIVDSDTVLPASQLAQAVERARATNQLVIPCDDRRELSAAETERVLHGTELTPQMGSVYQPAIAGAAVVTRRLWDAVGGFDEGYVGWGYEDTRFDEACQSTGGQILQMPGPLWHLYHDRSPEATRQAPTLQANKGRWEASHVSLADAYRSRPLPTGAMTADRIPQILHRVMTGTGDSTWEVRSHALPFDPKAWPLTSWAFRDLCPHPAQLAELIRLEALWRDGGVCGSADPDRLLPLLPLEGFVAGPVMGFRPHHPAVALALGTALDRFVRDQDQPLTGAIAEACQGRGDVLTLPSDLFAAERMESAPTNVVQMHQRHRDVVRARRAAKVTAAMDQLARMR